MIDLNQSWPMPDLPLPIVIFGAGSIVMDAHIPAYLASGFVRWRHNMALPLTEQQKKPPRSKMLFLILQRLLTRMLKSWRAYRKLQGFSFKNQWAVIWRAQRKS